MSVVDLLDGADEMVDVALALYEYGFGIIPLHPAGEIPPPYLIRQHGGDVEAAKLAAPKMPIGAWKEFQNRNATESEIREWWRRTPRANVGIVTGRQIVVLDADDQAAIEFVESGAVTRTPVSVRTGRGRQYYYRANPKFPVRNSASPRKLDVRGVGGYVVGPGSTHSTGAVYTLEIDPAFDWDGIDDLPELQPADLAAVDQYNGRGAVASSMPGVLFNTNDIRSPADGSPVEKGGRNNAAASLAGQYITAGMGLDEITARVHAWNDSNPAPLAAGELNRTIASVARTHTANNPDKPIPLTTQAPAIAKSGIVDLGPADAEDSPPPVPDYYLGDALLFEGARMLVAGPPKIGKSRFVLDLAVGIATGTSCLSHKCHGARRVVWMQAEIHIGFLAGRMVEAARGLADDERVIWRENFRATGRLDLDVMSFIDRATIREYLATRFEPGAGGVLILDPIINLSTADENSNAEVKAMLRQVDAIAAEFGVAVVLVHHTRKDVSAGSAMDGIRGASAFRGWFDTGLVLTGTPDETVLAYECRNTAAPAAHGVRFDERSGRLARTLLDDETPAGGAVNPLVLNTTQRAIYELIPVGPGGKVQREEFSSRAAATLGVSIGTVKNNLRAVLDLSSVAVERDDARFVWFWRRS